MIACLVTGKFGPMASSHNGDDVANSHHLSQSDASLKVCKQHVSQGCVTLLNIAMLYPGMSRVYLS